jgi:hypothetical protein
MTDVEFPDQVRVSGLPFTLQGWNNVYTKTAREVDGCPTYKLESYMLYWLFPIIGMEIVRRHGQWVMVRECDPSFWSSLIKLGNDQSSPRGVWSYGATVEWV